MALLIAVGATCAMAGDRPAPPALPLAEWWVARLDGAASIGPVADAKRVYVALASGQLTARDASDGHEIWRHNRHVTEPMTTDGEKLFVASGEAIEALDGATGKTMWTVPRMTLSAPLVAAEGWLIATTATEVVAIHAAAGDIAWRHAAGGVKLAPVVDGDRLYTGAEDGRVLALDLSDGSPAWERFYSGGVTTIAAHRGRVYVGAGDKLFYSLDGTKKGEERWNFRVGSLTMGRVAVDDEHVYFAALDNVIRGLDRQNGNQRWKLGMKQRPYFGVQVAGHLVFVSSPAAAELGMIYDHNGIASGIINLPGDGPNMQPAVAETKLGPVVYTVTGSLTQEWNLAKYAQAGEGALVPFASLESTPGVPYLTDPLLAPLGKVMGWLILGDPPLLPIADMDWPLVLRDPPLGPLMTLPGVQLRPLSPVLPVRPAGRGPGG